MNYGEVTWSHSAVFYKFYGICAGVFVTDGKLDDLKSRLITQNMRKDVIVENFTTFN